MSHCDKNGHCSHSHSHSSHKSHDSCCGSCCSCSCHEGHEHNHEADFAHQLIEMADEAWMEVLQEKIKAHIVANGGEHLDQLAKLVADSNNERWKYKLGAQNECSEFRDKVEDFFKKGK